MWTIVTIGVVLRIILSLITYHSDMQVFDTAGEIIASGNILNLYDFSSESVVFNYPPAIYLYHGLFRFLFGGVPHPFLLKLPYLFFDLMTGILLFKLSGKKIWAFALWIFNPINLYATYMMGQFDIIPTFFLVLSIYLALKGKLEGAALALGFGVVFKIYPIFLAIPLAIFGKNYLDKLKLLILIVLPYLLSVIPYLASQSFGATALFANQSSKSLYANIPVSGGEAIILFPAFLLFFYLLIWHKKPNIDLWKLYLIPLLLFFVFTHYHPQWLIWVTPLLILEFVVSGFRNFLPYILIFISWFASLFFFDPSLTIGIFSPVLPGTVNNLSIWTLLNLNPDYNLNRGIIQTVFTGASLYLMYDYFFKKTHV